MKKILIGVTIGVLLNLGYGFAQNDVQSSNPYLIGQVDKLFKTLCDVHVGVGYRTSFNRCRRNEVVVGADEHGIYCSDITVECLGTQVSP